MVGQISGEGSDSNSNRGGQGENNPNIRIFFNHSESPGAVRALIQGALEPLPVDPAPSRVVIHNIVVPKNREGRLSTTCKVSYESHARDN